MVGKINLNVEENENTVFTYTLTTLHKKIELISLIDKDKFLCPLEIYKSVKENFTSIKNRYRIDSMGKISNDNNNCVLWINSPFYLYEQIIFSYPLIENKYRRNIEPDLNSINIFMLSTYKFNSVSLKKLDSNTFEFLDIDKSVIKFDNTDNLLIEYYNQLNDIRIKRI